MDQGSLFLDLEGATLSAEERELLSAPQVGGVILFGRNTLAAAQVAELVSEIRQVRSDLVVGVDQEGGRVQRLREGVTRLPPMAALGIQYRTDPQQACASAEMLGYLMAAELRALDVDLSFAPVLDVEYGRNSVIGDRAFAGDGAVVSVLAAAFVAGMAQAGMAATGKHFPGHGWADADTHHADAVDARTFEQIWEQDLEPFRALIAAGLQGIMPAHVLYPMCSDLPAGFSAFWLQEVLRKRLGFEGVIFSDDLSMKAAHAVGGYAERARAALMAGCNVLLPCNNRSGALEVLRFLEAGQIAPVAALGAMRGGQFVADPSRLERARALSRELWRLVEKA